MYTHGHHPSVLASHQWRTVDNSAGYLLPHLAPGMSVLDVGCGPGTITQGLAAAVAPGRVVGIDPSHEVIEEASNASSGPGGPLFQVADIFDHTLLEASFDVVHAHQVLQHLSQPVAALDQMRRLVRPGGLIAVRDADYSAMAYYPQLAGLEEFFALYQRVARHNGGEPNAGRHLLHWASEAGLTDVECTASAWCYSTPAEVQWWSETWSTRATASGIAQTAVEAGLATPADLTRCADAWAQWGASPDAWFAVLHGELLAHV